MLCEACSSSLSLPFATCYLTLCQAYSGMPPPGLFAFEELVLGKDGNLNKEKRFPGTNKVQERTSTQQ